MESNLNEPSSSESPHQNVTEEVLSRDTGSFCDVNYVNDDNGIEYHEESFVNHFKSDTTLPSVASYAHFSIEPCSSSGSYAQVTLPSYSTVNHVTESNQNGFQEPNDSDTADDHFVSNNSKRIVVGTIPVSQILASHQSPEGLSSHPSTSSHKDDPQQPDADDELDRVSLSVDSLNLPHVSIVHHGIPNLGGLPILLDRNSLAALIASSSRGDASFHLDVSSLPRSTLLSSSQVLTSPRTSNEPQYLSSDILPPLLSQKDILASMIATSSTSTSSINNHNTTSFPINHKQMLAQKYAAEMLGPTTTANLIGQTTSASLINDQQLIESMSGRTSPTYVVASSAGSLIDSNSMAVYEDHAASLVAPTSVSQCLPLDVYGIDRGVSMVSSSRDSPESVMDESHEFENVVSHGSSHQSVQNFVSSSVDLVHSHHLDHSMHCSVDSTVGSKLHSDENIVDSSEGYSQHLESSTDNVLHTTTGGDYNCHISDMNSCDEAVTNEAVTSVLSNSNAMDANEALSSTSHGFSSHQQFSSDAHNSADDLHGCATVTSATHPDSTHSPVGMAENSQNYMLSSASLSDSADLDSDYSRPRRDIRGNRQYCGVFYDKECTQHRIQFVYDKPVLTRAFASLPATYLYVNKIGIDDDGDTMYGVFAKKTIPKRTQFGPIEGVLVKREDPPSDNFILLVEHDDGIMLYLDTSDQSMSNWMRFVRPADTHKEQNLVLVQQGESLFFNTTRSINPKTELRVWYSTTYAEKWGLPVLEPDEEEKRAMEEQENAWPCFECNQRFSSSEDLQKHLNQHDEENISSGIDVPRTKTLKARSRNKVTKKSHSVRLRSTLETITEGSDGIIIRKTRGRPPKKYKITCKQEDFKCEICYKIFPRNYSLQRHLIMHSGEKKYKCPICDVKFSHVYNRNRHVRRHKRDGAEHPAVKTAKSLFRKKPNAEWVCTHCGLTFDNSSVLNLHTLTHAAEDVAFNEENPFLDGSFGTDDGFEASDDSKLGGDEMHKCPECTQEFPHRRDLIEHASVHGKFGKQRCYRGIINPLKPFKCNLCYKSFASDERLIRHYLVHGSEDSKPLQCEICYKRFLNNSALACHIKVHSEERKFYECPICKMEFDQIVALKEHVHIHCENGVYKCPNCHKVFEEYNQVRKHIRAFHSERRYPCDKCEKIFPRPDKLKLHMLRHSDHREFLCANCGKQFKRKDKLKEHMKRMHAPEREAKVNCKSIKSISSKKFIPKVSPTDYHRFIYKCHTCLLGFKRRGMLVNHLAKRHPDIRPESVPELNLPILKTTRDYYCQYCEKVYKSSSKRKAHILKNHPGAELPMSNRRKGGVPEIPGMPNPTFSQTVGSITTHPHHCGWCHKQYASKAKLLQHQRKKHIDMLALSYVASATKVEPVCDQSTQMAGQIVIETVTGSLSQEAAAVLIDASKRKIHYVDRDALVVTANPDSLPSADLLTQAMSELTHNLAEYRSNGEFLTARLTQSTPATLVNPTPSSSPIPSPPSSSSPPSVLEANISAPLDQIQLSQLLAQYQQQQQLSSQQLAVVVTSVTRSWPTSVTTSLSNYPAR